MSAPSLNLAGMFPPVPTPFLGPLGEGVDWDALGKNISRYNSVDGITGFILQGSNGEYVMLSEEERVECVRRVRSMTSKIIVAGCGCEGTQHTLELGRKMLDAGANALLVITPAYFKASLNDKAIKAHFAAVAAGVHKSHGDKGKMVLYNMPANTGVDMSAGLVADVVKDNWNGAPAGTPYASPTPLRNIIALKDSGGNVQKLAIIRENTPAAFQLLAGSFGFLLPALSVGAVGGICAMANAFPEECCELMRLWQAGKLDQARALQNKLAEINFAVTAAMGVPAMKTAMVWRGFSGERHVRMPLLPLVPDQEEKLRGLFKKAGFDVKIQSKM